MNSRYMVTAARIRQELPEIRDSADRAAKAWDKYNITSDTLYLDSAALNLHDFYSGIERIFEIIAEDIDDIKPEGGSWHQNLLKQMAVDVPKVRPAVITSELLGVLDEFRSFRHIVRNVYAFNFKADRIKDFIIKLDKTYDELERELLSFCNFLENM